MMTIEIARIIDAAARHAGRLAADQHEKDHTQLVRYKWAYNQTATEMGSMYKANVHFRFEAGVAYHTDFRVPKQTVPYADPRDIAPCGIADRRLVDVCRIIEERLTGYWYPVHYFATLGVQCLSLHDLMRMERTASLISDFYPDPIMRIVGEPPLSYHYPMLVAPARFARTAMSMSAETLRSMRIIRPFMQRELEHRMGPIRDRIHYAHANVGGRLVEVLRKLRGHENGAEVHTIQQRILGYLYSGDVCPTPSPERPTVLAAASATDDEARIARAKLLIASTSVVADPLVGSRASTQSNKKQRIA